jgi:septal ring factor EnvC (AmiA/AmiB activator)
MAIPVEELLSLWRELERRRDELPAASVERQRLNDEIKNIRELYARVTQEGAATDVTLKVSRDAIARGRALLDAAHGRVAASSAEA